MSKFWQQLGILQSILVYYGIPFRNYFHSRFYAQFIQAGDLCFDIGAHIGDRLSAWSRLGARIIGLEPQPHCMRLLKRWYGNHPHITLVEQAVGSAPGIQTLFINQRTPTLTTLSRNWMKAIRQTDRFARMQWERAIPVTVTTLDTLIAQYGKPAFCKIDVEGYELEILRGLSQSIHTLSFEYAPAAIDVALGCIKRLGELDSYEFNWTLGDWPWLQSNVWLKPSEIAAHLASLPINAHGGDVYARRYPGTDQA